MPFIPVLLAMLAFFGVRFAIVLSHNARYKKYWESRLSEKKQKKDFHLLVLGDSIMQGVGASRPEYGLAGLIIDFVENETSRDVYVENISISGGKVIDVVQKQLPKARFSEADLVVIAVSANDALRQSSLEEYRSCLKEIVAKVPPKKTIIADVPGVKTRTKYQKVFDEVVGNKIKYRARFDEQSDDGGIFAGKVSGDFLHPSNKGYQIWFDAFRPELQSFFKSAKD